MATRRRSLTDAISAAPPPPEPAESPPADPPAAEATTGRKTRGPRRKNRARPAARDLITPARPVVTREALKVDVPADLELLQRLHRRRLDTGADIRDQVAVALDEFLTAEGY